MKKIIGLLSLAALITAAGCENKPAEVKKEIIVVPASPTIIIKDPVVKPTTIILDKNGVKVETRKVGVVVKKQ